MEQVASYVTGHFTERQKKWLHIKPLSDPPTLIIFHQTLIVTNGSDIRWQDFQPDILIIRSWRLHWIMFHHLDAKQSPLSPVDWSFSSWWFQRFFIFTPKIGEMIQFDSYFSNGLVQPPTSFYRLNQWLWNDFSCLWDTNPLLLQSLRQNPWLITNSIRIWPSFVTVWGYFKMMYNLHLQQNWLELVHFQKTTDEFGDISYFFKGTSISFHVSSYPFSYDWTTRPPQRQAFGAMTRRATQRRNWTPERSDFKHPTILKINGMMYMVNVHDPWKLHWLPYVPQEHRSKKVDMLIEDGN